MLRLVGRNNVELVDQFLDQWAPIIAGWVQQDLTPFVFAHAPDDKYAVRFAEDWLAITGRIAGIGLVFPPGIERQLSLLDENDDSK